MTSMHTKSILLALVVLALTLPATSLSAQEEESSPRNLVLKFFYFDSGAIEWAVSAEPDRLQAHLEAEPDSARMFQSLIDAADAAAGTEQVRVQMAAWLEGERERITEPGSNVVRLRKAEGIVAYLRAHDFDIGQLVGALLRRSGATGVELVAVHLRDRSGTSSFQLKVVLPDERIGIGGQGFNVAFNSPEVTYTSVVYALGLALYEVHEIINSDSVDEPPAGVDMEPLPPPQAASPAEVPAADVPPAEVPPAEEEGTISRTTR